MTRLLDQYGQPLEMRLLDEPQTARIAILQNQFIESHLERISPANASRMLRTADDGDITAQHQLFDDMIDRDPHMACEFGKRTNALLGLDWSIDPPVDATAGERGAAAWAEDILKNAADDLEEMISALMDGVAHGFSGVEIEWRRLGKEWLPVFHPRPQTWFQLSLDRRELLLKNGTGDGEPLFPFGWIMHQHKLAKTGYLGRIGLCRVLIWPFMYKFYAAADFAEFLETYGLPIITGKYYAGAPPAEKAALMRAVTRLGHDARAIMPKEMELEIAKVVATGDGDPHLKMIDWAERSQSKGILGQTLSAEAHATGMGSGVARLHDEVRHDILVSDARRIASTLTRDLVYPLLTLNGQGGDTLRRCPRWAFDTSESEDLKSYSEALPELVGMGMRIPVAWAHEKLKIPLPADDAEEILAIASPPDVLAPELRPEPGKGTQRDGRTLNVRKTTRPEPDLLRLCQALGLSPFPGKTRKFIS
jgi:phage gp29-like protein